MAADTSETLPMSDEMAASCGAKAAEEAAHAELIPDTLERTDLDDELPDCGWLQPLKHGDQKA